MTEPRHMDRTRAALIAGLLLCAGQAPPLQAAEAPVQPDVAVKPADPQPAAPKADPKSAPGDGTTDKVFVPTEEISEDFTVAFPVDI